LLFDDPAYLSGQLGPPQHPSPYLVTQCRNNKPAWNAAVVSTKRNRFRTSLGGPRARGPHPGHSKHNGRNKNVSGLSDLRPQPQSRATPFPYQGKAHGWGGPTEAEKCFGGDFSVSPQATGPARGLPILPSVVSSPLGGPPPARSPNGTKDPEPESLVRYHIVSPRPEWSPVAEMKFLSFHIGDFLQAPPEAGPPKAGPDPSQQSGTAGGEKAWPVSGPHLATPFGNAKSITSFVPHRRSFQFPLLPRFTTAGPKRRTPFGNFPEVSQTTTIIIVLPNNDHQRH